MKAIEEKMCDAIKARRPFKLSNTEVRPTADGCEVFLFGHHIATVKETLISFSLCGHNTATTRSRLRAILPVPLYQRRFELFVGDRPIDSHQTHYLNL
jgi:hypothetical protein